MVEPLSSSRLAEPSFAALATRAISLAVSQGSRASALRTTGTISPLGVWAAMPRWTAAWVVRIPPSSS